MDRVCCEVLKQMSNLIHSTTWTNKSSTLPLDDVSRLCLSVAMTCLRSGSVEIQRQAYDLLETLLPEISDKSFIIREESEMPKQSPRDLCVVHLSNRLVRLFPLLIERSIDGIFRKAENFEEKGRLFVSSSNLEEIIVRTIVLVLYLCLEIVCRENIYLSSVKRSYQSRIYQLKQQQVRTSLIRPSSSMDEGHSLCLASICTILVAASPNPSKLCGFVSTALRAKSGYSVISEVARTFRLACHKAFSRVANSSSHDITKDNPKDVKNRKGVITTVGYWLGKCATIADTQSLIESSLFSLAMQRKIVVRTKRLILQNQNLSTKTILTALNSVDLLYEILRIIVESPSKELVSTARCIINDVSKLLMAMYSIGLNKDDDEQYGALFKATLRLVRELSPLTKQDEIDDDDSESECEDSMSIFNVDTFDIDHSRTSFVEDAMRIDLQEVVTLEL